MARPCTRLPEEMFILVKKLDPGEVELALDWALGFSFVATFIMPTRNSTQTVYETVGKTTYERASRLS
jgi:hypothetical protein